MINSKLSKVQHNSDDKKSHTRFRTQIPKSFIPEQFLGKYVGNYEDVDQNLYSLFVRLKDNLFLTSLVEGKLLKSEQKISKRDFLKEDRSSVDVIDETKNLILSASSFFKNKEIELIQFSDTPPITESNEIYESIISKLLRLMFVYSLKMSILEEKTKEENEPEIFEDFFKFNSKELNIVGKLNDLIRNDKKILEILKKYKELI